MVAGSAKGRFGQSQPNVDHIDTAKCICLMNRLLIEENLPLQTIAT